MATKLYLDQAGLEIVWGKIKAQNKVLADAIETLNGEATVDGSVKKTVASAIADVVNNAPQDFDTLKEIADWIANDQTGAAALTNRIASLEGVVGKAADADAGTEATGLVADVASLKTTVGDNTSGLVKAVADNTSAIGTESVAESSAGAGDGKAATGIYARIETIEGNIGAVTDAVIPIATKLGDVITKVGNASVAETSAGAGDGVAATGLFARVESLETANANADTIGSITSETINSICNFTYEQSGS